VSRWKPLRRGFLLTIDAEHNDFSGSKTIYEWTKVLYQKPGADDPVLFEKYANIVGNVQWYLDKNS